jgi:hypothetical protein
LLGGGAFREGVVCAQKEKNGFEKINRALFFLYELSTSLRAYEMP